VTVGLATALIAAAVAFVSSVPQLAVVLLAISIFFVIRSAYLLWGVATALTRLGRMLGDGEAIVPRAPEPGEVGVLLQTVARMLETIEQQTAEIGSFGSRLDAAYKELENTNNRLKETSFQDEVTGLYNRRFFCIRLEEEIHRSKQFRHPVSVVLINVDGFKAMADDVGRLAAEDTLRDLAEVLVHQTRSVAVVARFDGELFAVLLVEASKDHAREYANRLWSSLHSHSDLDRMSPRFGIASVSDGEAETVGALLEQAEEDLRRNWYR
jgi:diguanylate cyclase (GGDEF)-like protein